MFEVILNVAVLVAGILLMTLASDKAVEHSIIIASALGISPLMIGFTLVSIGTDLPEIVNSIVASALGHGDINAGDSIGSVLTQLTLIFGLLPFLGTSFKVNRREILATGSCLILALILVSSIVEKGHISRINALFLIGAWLIYMLITKEIVGRGASKAPKPTVVRSKGVHILAAVLGFVGVAVGAYAVVQSVITLSATLNVPEYIISFFLIGIGTSLPELAVDLTALRKKQYEIATGDIIGSCVVDASLSIGIGQVFFPQAVSSEIAEITTLFTIIASLAVIFTLAARKKVDKKAGAIFIAIYLLSYTLVIV